MKSISLFLALILITASYTLAQDSNVRSVIEKNNEKWEKAMIDGDYDIVMDMYADDVISLPSYSPMMRGKSKLQEQMKEEVEKGMKFNRVEFNTVEVKEAGNVAIEVGTYDMDMTMGENAESMSDKGKYITVWEKMGNDWKVIMETWNTDTNPWEKMKQNEEQMKETEK
jgi:ketosteroid isomerase-like protein